jgi:exonuclease SbcD
MRLIHTADWHLGRIFHQVHLTVDQAYVLDQLIGLVKETQPDVVLVSGDIYDRAVPPPDAVRLLDDVLSRIVLGLTVPVVLIAGNHDSPERLSFAGRLLAQQQLHVFGSPTSTVSSVRFQDEHGPVSIYAIPYAEPPVVRERLAEGVLFDELAGIHDHDSAMRAMMDRVLGIHPRGERALVVAHAFVAGGEESESERPLSVGGAARVESLCFQGIHYVALGHLHRPQAVGEERIQYPGSLLAYSFSEAGHAKSVNLVELHADGTVGVERISLVPRRNVRCIEGYLSEILKGPEAGENRDDYLMVTLNDKGPILDAMGKLQEVYPNVLHIERPVLTVGGEVCGTQIDHRKVSDAELFASFFSQVTGDELTEEEAAAYASVVDEYRRREREVVG